MKTRIVRSFLILLVAALANCESDSLPPPDAPHEPPILPDDWPDDPSAFTETVIEPAELPRPDPFSPPPIRPSNELEWPVD